MTEVRVMVPPSALPGPRMTKAERVIHQRCTRAIEVRAFAVYKQ